MEAAIQNNTNDILHMQFDMTTNDELSKDNVFLCDELMLTYMRFRWPVNPLFMARCIFILVMKLVMRILVRRKLCWQKQECLRTGLMILPGEL